MITVMFFIDEGETLYHVQDTWENYFKLKVIDNSYNFWKDNIQNK